MGKNWVFGAGWHRVVWQGNVCKLVQKNPKLFTRSKEVYIQYKDGDTPRKVNKILGFGGPDTLASCRRVVGFLGWNTSVSDVKFTDVCQNRPFLDLFSSRGCHVLLFNVMGCCCQAQEDLDKVKQLDIDDMWLQVGVFDGKTNNQITRCSMYGRFTYMKTPKTTQFCRSIGHTLSIWDRVVQCSREVFEEN